MSELEHHLVVSVERAGGAASHARASLRPTGTTASPRSMASHSGSAKRVSMLEDQAADDTAAAEATLTNAERERLIAAIEDGRADLRAGRVTLTKELDEALGPLE